MWKTGHSLIKQKMKETKAPLAGEMSGHMFFGGDWYGFDDALFAAARLLRYMAEVGDPCRGCSPIFRSPSPPRSCVSTAPTTGNSRSCAAPRSTSPTSTLSPPSTACVSRSPRLGLLRASNTQPVLVLRFEAATDAALASYRTEVESWLAAQSPGA